MRLSAIRDVPLMMNNSTEVLRNEIIHQRDAMNRNTCDDHSHHITQQVLIQPFFEQSHRIAIYLSRRNEVHTQKIIEAIWEQGKQCYLPVLAPDTPNSLHFLPYHADTPLQPNRFNILEPAWNVNTCLPAENLDLVFTPLVGFDAQCHRIGMGAGYYDRTFEFLNATPRPKHPLLIGLAYEMQKVDEIFAQPWDVRLNGIVTEEKVYHSPMFYSHHQNHERE